jgi:alpha-glucosidase
MKLILGLLAAAAAAPCAALSVTSPDGAVEIRLNVDNGRATYSVSHRGKPVLLDSGLGLTLAGTGSLGVNLVLGVFARTEHTGDWKPVYGERSLIPENYRAALADLGNLRVELRAYNEGAALRYVIPRPGDFTIASEETEFHFPEGTRAWETHGAQQQFENVWVKDIRRECERPLTVEYPDGRYASLVEAGTRNYARMLFSPAEGKPWTLVSDLSSGKDGIAATGPFTTPWRAVIVGDRPGDLLERNYLLLNLNPPSTLTDTSWIKPGKVIREITLSTKGAREAVDFAKARRLQYIEFDAGWYGHEYDDGSDARAVNVDPLRKQSDPAYVGLDLPQVIRYAHDNGVGVLLYVNRRALEKQWDVLAPLYEQWGVQGVKFGFVNVGNQRWTKWLYDSVELAGKHHLMVDIHDEHRPTGLSRTYPHLMTQEGIAGNETMPTADHNTVLPFTRFVAGAADYTICYYDARIKTTRAHQLALSVVYYSPLQFMYWYDRPAAYQGEKEVEFFDRVPTVWDETRVVEGEIGRWVTVARRSGGEWFVGSINNGVARRVQVPLGFLPAGKFRAHIYGNGKSAKEVAVSIRDVDASTVLEASLPAAGGQAIWIEPAR